MADPRFFRAAGPFSVAEIAALTGAAIAGAGDAGLRLDDVGSLDRAGPHHLSFLSNRKYGAALGASRAGAAFVHPTLVATIPQAMTALVTPAPYRAFAVASQAFHPLPKVIPGIAPSAVVDPSAEIASSASIAPLVVVGAHVSIGPGTSVGAGTIIADGVIIGSGCRIGPHVTISHALIGDRVTLLPGVRIGQDGFGFAPDPTGHVRIPQLGRVVIEDDVEIGANTTIDRGAGPDTVVGAGSMIDNLVQIAHNVTLGRGCILVAQSGIAGSTHLGDFVTVGGQTAIIGHLEIGAGARIAGKAGVIRDVPAGATMGGIPAVPMIQWLRQSALLTRLVTKKET